MRHAVIVLIAVSCLSLFAPAQTAEELVSKNIQAKGGVEKMKAIHSVRMTGKLNAGGGFIASVAQEILHVVGELHDADAQRLVRVYEIDVVPNHSNLSSQTLSLVKQIRSEGSASFPVRVTGPAAVPGRLPDPGQGSQTGRQGLGGGELSAEGNAFPGMAQGGLTALLRLAPLLAQARQPWEGFFRGSGCHTPPTAV